MKKKIKLELVVDIVCPWCYVGKTTLFKAMESVKDEYDFDVSVLPFQLDPGTPAEGVPRAAYLAAKFGNSERFQMAEQRVIQAAAAAGAELHFDKMQVQINTMDCHRLIWWAGTRQNQVAVTNEIYKAYYAEALDLSQREVLADVMARVGYARNEVLIFLQSEQGFNEVAALIDEAYALGISGVPFVILNREAGISGAQPLEVFLQAFQQV
ncbi:DsbA family oxidoreductase [Bdellovibrio bacteriovorus]|uniref:DsbA family oxidoreductase n=1 Tax=Bdellovibrio bacteriovorus TaxID=959 RepID=UPI003AA9C70C